ncbi:hypothetical protein lbkm_4062 [Lachnospiraceae bacterium KM106-2]|nr:hypothetical protein lbkm_4062 [Lachnospiraceae bacterium KM106-2]
MIEFIILFLIAAYAGFVITKKVKDIKKGKYCSCGCDSCTSSSKCKNIK